MSSNSVQIHNHRNEPWKVTMLYTGQDTMTGGRLLRAKDFLYNKPFMLTYDDGVCDVNIKELLSYHERSGKIGTVTSVQPMGKYGALEIGENNIITSFVEKPKGDGTCINGGFFVFQPEIFDYLQEGEKTVLEKEPLENLAQDKKLCAFKHEGFWKAMDTLRDKNQLTEMWMTGKAP